MNQEWIPLIVAAVVFPLALLANRISPKAVAVLLVAMAAFMAYTGASDPRFRLPSFAFAALALFLAWRKYWIGKSPR